MKILHISYEDLGAGAFKASYRLHSALLELGENSNLLVNNKTSDSFSVINYPTKLNRFYQFLNQKLNSFGAKILIGKPTKLFSFLLSPFGIMADIINAQKPDIVHLHWIYRDMIQISELKKINAPIVWTLHDMWPYTGGCHYSETCVKYQSSCGECPLIGSLKPKDITRKVFQHKEKIYAQISDLTFVGVSNWITNSAKKSSLLRNYRVTTISNPIDTNVFKPINKSIAKKLFNISPNKKIILFGALSPSSDERKGFKELIEALKTINNEDLELVVFGMSKPEHQQAINFKTYYVGHLFDEVSMSALYNVADVMVVPSLQEAFGQTASEALSCKIPVVAFNTTGLKDIVDHKKNGYLANPFDSKDLAKGISWVLNNKNYSEISSNARIKVLNAFDSKIIGKKFIELYREILEKQKDSK